jgi:hypothetical protein
MRQLTLLVTAWLLLLGPLHGVVSAHRPGDPPHQLYQMGDLTLESGKVMKDFAISYVTHGTLNANKSNAILMVGHVLEYHPAVLALRELISDGQIGKVLYLYSNRLNFGRLRTEENALWSFAPHDIALLLRLVGTLPLTVSARGGEYLSDGVADVTLMSNRQPDANSSSAIRTANAARDANGARSGRSSRQTRQGCDG